MKENEKLSGKKMRRLTSTYHYKATYQYTGEICYSIYFHHTINPVMYQNKTNIYRKKGKENVTHQ